MKQHIFPALRLTAVCLVIFCGLYSLLVLGIAQFAPAKGEGETVSVNGKVVGYTLEGQSFTADRYFNGRPSAAAYNAAGSSGSNKGPSNPAYLRTVQDRIDSFIVHNPTVKKESIPADLVTASGSGLDPDISVEAALVQTDRIAGSRNIPVATVKNLIEKSTHYSSFNGIRKINVLAINIQLDKIK